LLLLLPNDDVIIIISAAVMRPHDKLLSPLDIIITAQEAMRGNARAI